MPPTTQFPTLERFSLFCRLIVGLACVGCGCWVVWHGAHTNQKAEMIFLVWAGACLILFGLSYAWIQKLETFAIYFFVPLAVAVLFHGVQQYWHYRSTIYGANYRNEVIVALVYFAGLAFYQRRKNQKNDGEPKWRRR